MRKIAILGCGALGSTFGGLLTEAGFDVSLVNLKTDHTDAMEKDGLIFVENDQQRTVSVKVFTNAANAGPVDLIIVLVKSNFTKAAIEGAKALIGPDTIAMSLQNGLGNEEVLEQALGRGRVLGGKTYVGGTMLAPGKVKIGVKGKKTLIGEFDGSISERAEQISSLFSQAGLATEVIKDIRALTWQKLLVNVATGALCGITRLTYGPLMQFEAARECATAAVAEALAVAEAAGIRLDVKQPRDVLDQAVAGLPYDFKTSILQDVERGTPCEVDYINGAVVREGEKHGVPTPVNKTLLALLKGIEFQRQQ